VRTPDSCLIETEPDEGVFCIICEWRMADVFNEYTVYTQLRNVLAG
jgi:hypothetical protein